MPPPYHSLHRRLEDVLRAFLTSNQDLGMKVYRYMDVVALGEGVVEPYVGIRCQRSTSSTPEVQLVLGTGSRIVTAQFLVVSHALHATGANPLTIVQEYRDVHDKLVGDVIDSFMRDDLITALNEQAANIGGVRVEQVDQFEMNDEPQGRSGTTEITMPIMCHPQEG
jgi:hypothetical protein